MDFRGDHRAMTETRDFKVKIFADGADVAEIVRLSGNPLIKGFTTNPTLMHKAGVTDYRGFARDVVAAIPALPVSFEVFADDFDEMERQALEITGWGENLYVKIPITNTRGESAVPLMARLAGQGVKVNATALMTRDQVKMASQALADAPGGYISVFAGRIADTGRDPVPEIAAALEIIAATPQLELIWASPREVFDIVRANDVGCHVITVTYDLLRKSELFGKDLAEFSLETVRMFYGDACAAGYSL